MVKVDFGKYVLLEETWLHALVALSEYAALEELLCDDENVQSRMVWIRVHSFLTHSAMVSRLVFATGKRSARTEYLQRVLLVEQDSPLRDRAARDNVEHLDERFDDWLSENGVGLMEIVVPSRKGYEYIKRQRVRRLLIRDEMVFVTQGRGDKGHVEVSLEALRRELERTASIADALLDASTLPG